MVGLDLTYQALATTEIKNRIAQFKTPVGQFLSDVLTQFSITYQKRKGSDEPPVHDPCAVAYVIDPDCIETLQAPVHVEYRGIYTNGMTVADLRRKAPADCHTYVATKYVIDPDCIETLQAPVHVEYRGIYTNGMTVADLRRKAPADCHTYVATKLNHARFWEMIEEAVHNLETR